MQLYDSAVERIMRDISKGDSLDRAEGDSSVVTPDDRDSAVQPSRVTVLWVIPQTSLSMSRAPRSFEAA